MDFRGCIGQARSQTVAAVAELDRYDRTASPDAPRNRATIDSTIRFISPGATSAGAAALDAARWDRRVGVRQVRDAGTALELLDSAWWSLTGRGGTMPDVDGARRALLDAVGMLDRASWGSRWAALPVAS